MAKSEKLIRTWGRGQPAANGVAEASSRPIEAAGFPCDSFEEASASRVRVFPADHKNVLINALAVRITRYTAVA